MTNNILRRTLLFVSFATFAAQIAAQQNERYRYDDAMQLWRLTDNAAGLGFDNSRNRGYAELGAEHREGDYFRVQDGTQRNQLTFNAERYQAVGRFLMGYGRFTFSQDRTKNRAFADIWRPHDSNPFFSGSNIPGKYDTQLFDLTAALATKPIPLGGTTTDKELTLGMRLDYAVGDKSRLRDPRSRNQLLTYRLTPSVAYSLGNSTLGLDGHYERRKEKLPSLTTVQEDPGLTYYTLSGMEAEQATVGGYKGFSREWVNHELGAEITYAYNRENTEKLFSLNGDRMKTKAVATVNTVSIARGKEDAWGQYKYSPGQYTQYIYKAASHTRVSRSEKAMPDDFVYRRYFSRKMKRYVDHKTVYKSREQITTGIVHAIDAEATATQGYADEYRQTLVQERDAQTGYTSFRYDNQLTYRKRYQLTTYDAQLHYRLNSIYGTKETRGLAINGYAGATAQLEGATTKHLLHTSKLDRQRLNFTFEGGHAFFKGKLWLDATATYSHATKAALSLADNTTDYAQQVLLPDMAFYDSDYWRGCLSLTYTFPLTLKGTRSEAYLKAATDITKAQHALERRTFGLTLGLFN